MKLQQILARRVIDGMEAKNWTRKRLAQEAFISESHLSGVLRGCASASVEIWDDLLRAVNKELEEVR